MLCAWRGASRHSSSGRATRSGIPIEIISGIEEARLIYLGVAHTMPSDPGRRLVVDIGGGSTELIIGEGLDPLRAGEPVDGLRGLSERSFGDGKISAEALAARTRGGAARARAGAGGVPPPGWEHAVGQLRHDPRDRRQHPRISNPAAARSRADGLERLIHETIDARPHRASFSSPE